MSRSVTAHVFPFVRNPPNVDLGHSATVILLVVLRGAVTYDDIIEETGLNRSTVATHLHQLRDAGLVTWEPGMKATLRPTCRPVPFGGRR